ncbi:MAG: purine-nucleoside/S-methyl-5-thioadenosine phosphorylase / adenosine deaminase [Acidobacteriota bacterium]|nr:purine-nucleoside/S-methyl-5-thioadenosine phosphorylase / adenosine deaminase [Acidobacteriota bacterium]
MPTETINVFSDPELTRAGFYWRAHANVRALSSRALDDAGFANAFSTRTGGVSPFPANDLNLAGFDEDTAENIHENRRRFLALFEGDWTLAACWQVHGTNVRTVRAHDPTHPRGEDERCDALTTDLPRLLLGVKTADCVPILLADPRTGACAAIHAGWRGTTAQIVSRTVARMKEEHGTRALDVSAAIGPAALSCCYEVGSEVIETFKINFTAYADSLFTPTRQGHALIDLHEANRRQLIDAGVSSGNVFAAPLCTMCRTDLFFSYRREKKINGRTGRLLAVIGRPQAHAAPEV